MLWYVLIAIAVIVVIGALVFMLVKRRARRGQLPQRTAGPPPAPPRLAGTPRQHPSPAASLGEAPPLPAADPTGPAAAPPRRLAEWWDAPDARPAFGPPSPDSSSRRVRGGRSGAAIRPQPGDMQGVRIGDRAQYSRLSGGHGGPPDVPLGERQEPLPHDGLFIRRNNAFGTKSVIGIADLIDQGVLIGQEQIRFDDFVASRAGDVPAPPDGTAVAVSHGRASAIPGCTAKSATTHFLEIALRAPDAPAAGQQATPLPVNFVFAVDVSSSMASADKLDSVKASLHELYEQLRDDDVLGIVTFNSQAATVLRATRKADLPRDQLLGVVDGLRASGGTDLNLGVLYGIDETGRHAHDGPAMVNCLYLFSDGAPTSGVRNWIEIRANIAERLRGDLTLSCFGFGADVQLRELEALAGLSGGSCTLVTRPEDVRLNLDADLTRREHLAAINIQLQIEINPRTDVWHLYGHDLISDPARRAAVLRDAGDARRRGEEEFGVASLPDLITQENGIRIFAPDLAFGETYWIVFELETPADIEADDLGQATVQYVDTVARQPQRHELALTPDGAIPDSVAAAHAVGLWTSEVTFYALDDLYANDRTTAKERLTRHIAALELAHKTVPARQFLDDQVTFRKFVTLSSNLGQRMSLYDAAPVDGGQVAYTTFMLSSFGRVRSGYQRLSYLQ
jgi:von Willebrand factor type A domain